MTETTSLQPTSVPYGMFDWIDQREGTSVSELYQERFRIVAAAEDAGFYAYHLAEHHSTRLGMAPSPSVFLAALSQHTSRIRLAPLVYLLPLYSPFRLAEEICMLDHLSGGRFEFGVGRGASRWEARGFGVSAEEAKPMMEEGLEVLIEALRTGVISHSGSHYRYDTVATVIRPLQDPHPPLWYAAGSPESVIWSAQNSLNIISNIGGTAFGRLVSLYQHVRSTQPAAAEPINPHIAQPKMGLNRQLFVAPTQREALEIARSGYGSFFDSFTSLWYENGDHSVDRTRAGFDADLKSGVLVVGSPAQVQDALAADIEASGANYVTGSFAWGDLTMSQAIDSIELFASAVAPGLPVVAAPATADHSGLSELRADSLTVGKV